MKKAELPAPELEFMSASLH